MNGEERKDGGEWWVSNGEGEREEGLMGGREWRWVIISG